MAVAPQDMAALLGGAGPIGPAGTPPPADVLSAPPSSPMDPITEEREWKDPTAGMSPIEDEVYDQESGNLEPLGERLNALFRHYENARSNVVESAWELSENLYDGEVDSNSFPYGSIYEIREVFRQVEASRALSVTQLFGQRRRFKYVPLQPESEEIALRATAVVARQLKQNALNKELIRWVKMPAKIGTSYLFEGWANYRRIKRKLTQLHDVEGKVFDRLCEEVENGGPWLEWIDHWKVFVWPWIEELENQRAVFIRELVDGEYLRTMVREGEFDKKQVEKALETEGGALTQDNYRRQEWENQDPIEFGDREFELTRCWTSTGWCYSNINNVVVQGRRNGFERIPMRALKYYQNEGIHYGVSEPQILAAEQMFLRDAASMWIDSIHYKLQPMWIANRNLLPNWKNTFFSPGKVVWADGKPEDAVKPLPTNADTFQLEHVMEYFKRNMQNTTSLTAESTGQGSRHRTATGMMQLQQAASLRHELKLIEWVDPIERVYQDIYEMNRLFLNEDVVARVESSTGEEIPGSFGPQIFEPEVDVELNVESATEPPGMRQQRLLPLLQIAANDPRWNYDYLIEQVGIAFELPNPKKLKVSPVNTEHDVLQELKDWQYGILPDPTPSENHMVHLAIHTMFEGSPVYAEKSDEDKLVHARHKKIHESYLAQMQGMPNAAGQMEAQGGAPQYPVSDQANATTEAMVDNAGTGAAQQGRTAG